MLQRKKSELFTSRFIYAIYLNETIKYTTIFHSRQKNSERSGTILLKKLKILKFVVRINNPFVPLTIANYSGRIFSRTSTNLFFDSSVQF